MSSLFLLSRAMFLRAVATEQTTRSLSILSSSTRMGRPFSLRTAARMYAANWDVDTHKEVHTHTQVSRQTQGGTHTHTHRSVDTHKEVHTHTHTRRSVDTHILLYLLNVHLIHTLSHTHPHANTQILSHTYTLSISHTHILSLPHTPSSCQQTGSAGSRRSPPGWQGWSSRPAGPGKASPRPGATASQPP